MCAQPVHRLYTGAYSGGLLTFGVNICSGALGRVLASGDDPNYVINQQRRTGLHPRHPPNSQRAARPFFCA